VTAVEGSIEGPATGGVAEGPGDPADPDRPHAVLHRSADASESLAASRAWWDHDADRYLAEHGQALGPVRLLWGPEGADESGLSLLGEVSGQTVLEVGCGAGQGARWLRARGADAVGVDVSHRMLQLARRLDGDEPPAGRGRWVQGDAGRLPFAASSFDLAVSSYGALPFVPDLAPVFAEVHRVLRGEGRWAFSVTHPFRWCFLDDAGPAGLVVRRSYFDRRAYVEEGPDTSATYVEHHHTMGDVVGALAETGFAVTRLVEPTWSGGSWGGAWSEERGRLVPGTAVFVAKRGPRG
jgi:SAM-dependent methyltransferase